MDNKKERKNDNMIEKVNEPKDKLDSYEIRKSLKISFPKLKIS